LYNVSDFCKKYQDNQSVELQPVNNKLLIIDEAQRVWNPIQIALAKKNKLSSDQQAFIIKNEVSEAKLVLRAVLQAIVKDNKSRTVVFLMGSGQEIYIGEEDGEAYIQKAIEHIKGLKLTKEVGIHLFVPTQEMADTYSNLGHTCEVKIELLLKQNKRNAYNDSALEFVSMIIDGSTPALGDDLRDAFYVFNDYKHLKEALEPINTGAFSIGLVANGFDTLTEWVPGRYGNEAVSYLNLGGKKITNISNQELKDFYVNKVSNAMMTFASQFNCQGLELDYTVMIWGNMMLRRNDRWELSTKAIGAIDKYCEKLSALVTAHPELTNITVEKDALRDTFVRNCYRVLLTRARIATYIFIEDDETYTYIKTVIRK
ncbi:MAG TPA: DNA/RNA helicase domain-containing protein, partial [Candidatus Nitrosocosmicus sp.]|nr:DNA/RNA helicase domain-containing protein [Candidatus Nitrosocosmicus sp.]